MMNNNLWWEKWLGDCCFYFGFFGRGMYQVGVQLGNRNTNVDLIFFSFGFIR